MKARTLKRLLLAAALAFAGPALAQDAFTGARAQRITIHEFEGDAMEPFLSRDGRLLFFTTRTGDDGRTDLLVAARIDNLTFRSLGPVRGANSPALDASASLDRQNRFYFASTRAEESLNTLFSAPYSSGGIQGLRALTGVDVAEPGRRHFDPEISADGRSLYYADSSYLVGRILWAADIHVARRYGDARFARDARSRAIFARINTSDLEYAPALSPDERELYFARQSRMVFSAPAIWRATRPDPRVAFADAQRLPLDGYVESPTVAADGAIYFHRREDGAYWIWRLPRNPAR